MAGFKTEEIDEIVTMSDAQRAQRAVAAAVLAAAQLGDELAVLDHHDAVERDRAVAHRQVEVAGA